ncbi:hypothetical protein [Streptomyces sp. NBC_00503]|uniref:hypothetical protein n=1 Tax=Streptomyces sp. NBC_00503 TaxID=2903659 RepID=UPI002E7FCC85|nr:hypothetical protein [Streptomyces sp. NBC_00503]WUD81803.1 hypothetical protein OG490_15380 [Streptomyces sp. NBC_00503]
MDSYAGSGPDSVNNSISGGNFYGPVIMGRDTHMPEHGLMAAPVPRMLPFGPDGFVDREVPRARLDELLAGSAGQSAPQLVLLHGTLGVGKTGLALHWGQERREAFPGGVFYADLTPQGLGHPVEADAVLESFLGQLRIPVAEMPASEAELAARFRSLTAGQPALVVLDGVPSAAAVRHLLPGHPASMVVMTSQFRLGAFAEGRLPVRLPVPALDEEACAALFRAVVGEDVASSDALRTVLRASAGLPYVVRIAAAHAADPVSGGVEELAARIERENILEVLEVPGDEGGDPDGALDPLDGQATARRVFDLAHERLDPRLRAGFRLLGLHPTPEFPAAFLEALAPGTLRGLHGAGLLEPAEPGRFRMNGVLHGYAQTLAAADPAARGAGLERVIDWYLRRAAAAERKISPRWRAGELFPDPDPDRGTGPDGAPGPFATRAEAIGALEADRHTLAALAELRETGPARLCLLAQAVHAMFLDRGHHTLWIRIARLAQEAATDTGDGLMLARMHYELAFALGDRGAAEDVEEARLHYDAARESARRIGHERTESSALEGLGRIAVAQGRPQDAAELYAQALTALGSVEHPRGRALLEYHQGNAAAAGGQYDRAARHLATALRAFETLKDEANVAKTRLRSAAALLAAGRPREAAAPLELALEAFAEGTLNRADAVLVRGDLRAALGDPEAARSDWQAALAAYESLRSIRAEEPRIRLARIPDQGEPGH